MKKTLHFLIVAVILTSCGDLLISEKSTTLGRIPLKVYYESPSVVQVNDGFLVGFVKSYTNGDSTKCEVVSRTENIIAKFDFNGNKLWERIDKPLSFSPVAINMTHLWSWNGANKLLKYDNDAHLLSETTINYNAFSSNPSSINKFVSSNDGKLVGMGTSLLTNQSHQSFFCELSEKGIERWILIPDTKAKDFKMYFRQLTNGHWLGAEYVTEYAQNTSTATIEFKRYDKDFKILKTETLVLKQVSVYDNSFNFSKDELLVLYKEGNITKLMVIDDNFKRRETTIDDSQNWYSYIYSPSDCYIYSFPAKLFKIDVATLQTVAIPTDVRFTNPYLFVTKQNQRDYFIQMGTSDYQKGGTIFTKFAPQTKIEKILYESEYRRKCSRYE